MCGIAGYLIRDREADVDLGVIHAMTDAMAHRGPDGEGDWTSGPVGLGHRRLAVIDLQTGAQPMTNEDETLWIVCNGEIYNYRELRRDLARHHTFRTQSDTEVILHLYEELGERCLDRLNGMFAFAIWDIRQQRLFIARDRLGIKSLYWTIGKRHFAFASEVKALLAAGACEARLNPGALTEYFTFQYTMRDRTLFEGVQCVEPGHYLTFRPFQDVAPSVVRYWDFNYEIDTHHTFEYFSERLLSLLEDSVNLRLRSDVPLGAYLSGGIDSSVVTCLAAPRYGDRFHVFTGAFDDGPEFDESSYARLVAEEAEASYHEVRPTADDFIRLMPRLVYLMDVPMAGPGLFPQYCVSELAARTVKVCLGGQGGDELFGGYARYLAAYLEQCLKGAIYDTGRDEAYIVTWEAIAPHLPMLKHYQPLLQDFWRTGLFEDMDRRYFHLIARDHGLESILSPDAWTTKARQACFEDFRQVFYGSEAKSYFNRMTHFDLKTLLPALLHVEDRVSMGCSLESRVPLLDHRVAELVTTMPPIMRFEGGRSKHVLREAVVDLVPRRVLDRQDKMGFPVPFSQWLRGPIREFVCDTLLGTAARQRGLYRTDELERQITTAGKYSRLLWGILSIELWFQTFIDAAPATAATRPSVVTEQSQISKVPA
ncbi:MAG: asparagine synthase (glutamine-hydrolyzing) [Phycisphaerae bacterium]|nr:asparagine synthase (glutamine-hydrolyzing) [Phycisphaerae bacterium]